MTFVVAHGVSWYVAFENSLNIPCLFVGETGGFLLLKAEGTLFAISLPRNGMVFFTKSVETSGLMQKLVDSDIC